MVERGALARRLGVHIIDKLDPQQREIALAFFWRPDLAPYAIAGAQTKTANLRLRDIHIVGARQQARAAQEAKSVGNDIENAIAEAMTGLFGLGLQKLEDQILFFKAADAANTAGAGQFAQIAQGLGFKLCHVHHRRFFTWFTKISRGLMIILCSYTWHTLLLTGSFLFAGVD